MTNTTPAATPAPLAEMSTADLFRLIDILEPATLRSVLRRLAFDNKSAVASEINAVISGNGVKP